MKEKMFAISIAITTGLVYLLWSIIKEFKPEYPLLKSIVSALLSYGIYRFVFAIVSWILPQIGFLKRWLFGKQYLEGTWIGAYVGASGIPKIYYERYTQTYDHVKVEGFSFLLDRAEHASWKNTSFSISDDSSIFYTYSVQSFTETSSGNGYAQFKCIFDSDNKFIVELNGFTYDLHNGKQIASKQIKVQDGLAKDELIELAHEYFNANKSFYQRFNPIDVA